jgi:hypothetical protein
MAPQEGRSETEVPPFQSSPYDAELPGRRIFPELVTHALFAVSPGEADRFYKWQRDFWSKRLLIPEFLRAATDRYAQAMEKPYLAPIGARLKAIAGELPAGQPLRVLELGSAVAPLLNWWRAHAFLLDLAYTGIEPYQPFVDHVRARFPSAEMIEGDAEAFVAMDFGPRPRFAAFLAASVFCMIHSDVVRKCVVKAATLADHVLIRDYLVNAQGGILPEGILMFDYDRKPENPLMFAHHYDRYFAEAGLRVIHLQESRTEIDPAGWGILHAKRMGAA